MPQTITTAIAMMATIANPGAMIRTTIASSSPAAKSISSRRRLIAARRLLAVGPWGIIATA